MWVTKYNKKKFEVNYVDILTCQVVVGQSDKWLENLHVTAATAAIELSKYNKNINNF